MATVRVRDASELGAAVREARVQAGMSQVELASEAQVGRQWLVEFEAGEKVSAPFDMVMRLLRALALEVALDPTVRRRPPRPTHQGTPAASDVLARYTRQEEQ